MFERYTLPNTPWGLRKLETSDPQWTIQFMGMDWIKVEDFLTTPTSTLDDEMRKFAEACGMKPVESRDG